MDLLGRVRTALRADEVQASGNQVVPCGVAERPRRGGQLPFSPRLLIRSAGPHEGGPQKEQDGCDHGRGHDLHNSHPTYCPGSSTRVIVHPRPVRRAYSPPVQPSCGGRLARFFSAPEAGTIGAIDDFLMTYGTDIPLTRSWDEPVRLKGAEPDAVRALGARAAEAFVNAHVDLAGARAPEAAALARERLAGAQATLDCLAKRCPARPDAHMRSALERWQHAAPQISEDAMEGAATDVFDLIVHMGMLWVAAARLVLELFDKTNAPLAEDAASEPCVLVSALLFAFAGLEAAETDDAGLFALTEMDSATIRLERFARRYRGMVD